MTSLPTPKSPVTSNTTPLYHAQLTSPSPQVIKYIGAPFTFAFFQRYPTHRRLCSVLGLFTISLALITSSFSTRVWHLILTQGVLYALGGSMLYTPTIVFLDEWFITRKGFAFGVMWAGTGVSGVCVPFLIDWGLNKYSVNTMLRA